MDLDPATVAMRLRQGRVLINANPAD